MKKCCHSGCCDTSNTLDMLGLLEALESGNPATIEALREKINNDPELRRALTTEIGKHFLSCIALSEVFNLELDTFMNTFSPEQMEELFGQESDEECENEECDDEDDCCGTC